MAATDNRYQEPEDDSPSPVEELGEYREDEIDEAFARLFGESQEGTAPYHGGVTYRRSR